MCVRACSCGGCAATSAVLPQLPDNLAAYDCKPFAQEFDVGLGHNYHIRKNYRWALEQAFRTRAAPWSATPADAVTEEPTPLDPPAASKHQAEEGGVPVESGGILPFDPQALLSRVWELLPESLGGPSSQPSDAALAAATTQAADDAASKAEKVADRLMLLAPDSPVTAMVADAIVGGLDRVRSLPNVTTNPHAPKPVPAEKC